VNALTRHNDSSALVCSTTTVATACLASDEAEHGGRSRGRSCAGDSQDAGVVEDVSLQEKWSERDQEEDELRNKQSKAAKAPERGHCNRGVAALG
jgi:hypothetical protein